MTRRRRLSVVATTTIVLSLSPSPSRSFVRTTNVLSPPPPPSPTDVRSMSFAPPRVRRRRPLRAHDDDDDDDVVRHRAMEALGGGGGGGGEAGRSSNTPRANHHPRRRRAANANHDDEALPPLPPLFDRGVEDDDDDRRDDRSSSSFVPSSSSLEGVLPVSDLFYRPNDVGATDAGDGTNDDDEDDDEEHDDEELPFSAEQTDRLSTADGNRIEVTARERRTVDNGNGVGVGDAAAARRTTRRSPATAPGGGRATRRSSSKRRSNDNDNDNGNDNGNGNNGQRRMIRRGMEMLVGGRPINADPPLRVVELTYDVDQEDWARVVTVNTRDFGPFLHAPSVAAASYVSRGLFCEHFVANALKWKVCPDDLAAVVENDPRYGRRAGANHNATTTSSYEELVERMRDLDRDDGDDDGDDDPPPPRSKKKRRTKRRSKDKTNRFSYRTRKPETTKSTPGNVRIQFPDEPHVELVERPDRKDDKRPPKETTKETPGSLRLLPTTRARDETNASRPEPTSNNAPVVDATGGGGRAGRGFGAKPRRGRSPKQSPPPPTTDDDDDDDDNKVTRKGMDGQLRFALGLPASDLADDRNRHRRRHRLRGEANDRAGDADTYRTFSKIVAVAIARTVRAREKDHVVVLRPLKVRETTDRDDNVATEISVRFGLVCRDANRSPETLKEDSVGFQKALAEATDEGDLPVNLAASVRAEQTWSKDRRRRVSDELLIDATDAEDEEDEEEEEQETEVETSSLRPTPLLDTNTNTDADADDFPFYVLGFSVPPPVEEEEEDEDDDFPFSGSSSDVDDSPYKGDLGPLLVDAVARRAAERSPKVIAVGDVHGCLDELQALLRECVYRPGDVVVFLGDLVSKGPDSVSVVRLAREIGALGVRGNHDFEVVRWHQAIASGADVPAARSEHCRIASALDPADLAWLHGLPWYLSSETLGALFVHAGFVSGVRLAKQNPRLMMNMRSVLPDGTVTSKFFNNWPWARLWDGPQTVFFGHDADRGLQQYDHAVGLDTGCVYGGRLTACVLPERRIVSVPAKRQYFKYRRRHFD